MSQQESEKNIPIFAIPEWAVLPKGVTWQKDQNTHGGFIAEVTDPMGIETTYGKTIQPKIWRQDKRENLTRTLKASISNLGSTTERSYGFAQTNADATTSFAHIETSNPHMTREETFAEYFKPDGRRITAVYNTEGQLQKIDFEHAATPDQDWQQTSLPERFRYFAYIVKDEGREAFQDEQVDSEFAEKNYENTLQKHGWQTDDLVPARQEAEALITTLLDLEAQLNLSDEQKHILTSGLARIMIEELVRGDLDPQSIPPEDFVEVLDVSLTKELWSASESLRAQDRTYESILLPATTSEKQYTIATYNSEDKIEKEKQLELTGDTDASKYTFERKIYTLKEGENPEDNTLFVTLGDIFKPEITTIAFKKKVDIPAFLAVIKTNDNTGWEQAIDQSPITVSSLLF